MIKMKLLPLTAQIDGQASRMSESKISQPPYQKWLPLESSEVPSPFAALMQCIPATKEAISISAFSPTNSLEFQ